MSTVQSALATLPLSFPDPANVKIVDGLSDWPADVRRALDSGATAVVVLHPRPAEFADLLAAAAPVIVDSRWASNPVIDSAAQEFRAAESNRVECRVIVEPGSDFASALLDELMLTRALLGPVRQATVRYRSDRALFAEGSTADGLGVDFSVVCTSAVPTSATVRLLTSDGSVELTIPSGDNRLMKREVGYQPGAQVLAGSVGKGESSVAGIHTSSLPVFQIAAASCRVPVVLFKAVLRTLYRTSLRSALEGFVRPRSPGQSARSRQLSTVRVDATTRSHPWGVKWSQLGMPEHPTERDTQPTEPEVEWCGGDLGSHNPWVVG